MEWIDIASIVFACVTMNHLGLIGAIEEKIGRKIPIVNCTKCCSFWSVLAFTLMTTHDLIPSLAISFLSSYAALWIEMLEAYIDTLYLKLYGKITETCTNDTLASNADNGNSASSLPEL